MESNEKPRPPFIYEGQTDESRNKTLIDALAETFPASVDGDNAEAVYLMSTFGLRLAMNSAETDRKEANLEALWALQDLLQAVQASISERADVAKAYGASWDEIGRCLGVSRQAAQQKYGK